MTCKEKVLNIYPNAFVYQCNYYGRKKFVICSDLYISNPTDWISVIKFYQNKFSISNVCSTRVGAWVSAARLLNLSLIRKMES